jgi:tRNA A-37 threonylcarbamoyl transferase component Bud32
VKWAPGKTPLGYNASVSPGPVPFGRYLLLELLAEGGMAQVYRAVLRETSGFEKQVALKRVRRELGEDPEFVARFVDEARIASTLSHGNVVQVFDFGRTESGEHFLAMELVDGPDLGTLLAACREAGQPFPIPTATFVIAEVAQGLGAAHRRLPSPVVHRDVSPQNVLLSRSGEVKVVDFGIALAAEKALRTRTGLVLGKCRYMAPEQARGEALDARADVFATGAILFELLAGSSLFDGKTPEQVLEQVLAGPIPPLSSRNPEVPPALDEVLARALDRDRDRRPADGAALARELEGLLHRMAPEFTREDLAALIRVTVPPRRWLAWEAVATSPDGNALATTDLRPEPAKSAEPAATAGPAWEPPSVLVGSQSWVGKRGAPKAGVGRRGAPKAAAPVERARRRGGRLAARLLAIACLLGVAAGSTGAILLGSAEERPLELGTPQQLAAWTLRLDELEVGDGGALLRLHLDPAPPAADTPALFRPRLWLGGRHQAPALSASRRVGAAAEWLLVFAGPSDQRLPRLELHPPGGRPLHLKLLRSPR